MAEERTDDLFLAAFLHALGAPVVRYEGGDRGQGAIVLDLGGVTVARVNAEADRLASQLRRLPPDFTMADVDMVLNNTLLGPLADQLGKMRKQVLNRRPR